MQKYKPKLSTSVKEDSEEVVYFRLRRDEKEEPEEEFIVNTNPRKKCGTLKEEEKEKVEKKEENEAGDITKLFSHLGLNPVQYFLKKVDDFSANIAQAQLLHKANEFSNESRALKREELIAKSRGIEANKKIKIVDIEEDEDEEYVELGGKKIAVENLGKLKDHYYILSKRKEVKEGPELKLPQSSHYLLSQMDFEQPESESEKSEDEDSNRESNPDYDYPEEDYNEDSDEGVINRDYYPGKSDEENESDVELDEEEIYRKYLKRCSKKGEANSDDDYY